MTIKPIGRLYYILLSYYSDGPVGNGRRMSVIFLAMSSLKDVEIPGEVKFKSH